MKMYNKPQPVEKYLDTKLSCDCGRTHFVPIKGVEIGHNALSKLPDYMKKLGYIHPFIVCDGITYKIAGERCRALLTEAGIISKTHILSHLNFDEATLGEIVVNIPHDCDLMIGVGTGSITDIIRYSSYKLKLPCFTVATGAPMDGFAASIGIMNVNNLKCTMQAHNTEVIFGDTDILKTAPYRMTVAGFGDLIGKISCLNDWELARIINGEHYCRSIVELVKDCVNNILKEAEQIKERDPEVLGNVMRGLVLSGAAISLYGDSRPASGAEHHISHYLEAIGDQRGKSFAMHGEQVAVGTVMVLMMAEELANTKLDFDRARNSAKRFDYTLWEKEIRRAFGAAAQEVIDMEAKAKKNDTEKVLTRIDSMQKNWSEIKSQLESLPKADDLIRILRTIGCPCLPADIGVERQLLKDTLMYCKEVRPRYTILQTLFDLDLLDSISDKAIDRLYCLTVEYGK